VIVSKLNALLLVRVTQDVPQNVNFAIKAGIATNFLEANDIAPSAGSSTVSLEPTDIADRARQFTVQITYKPQK
jgi:serine protease Do